MFRVKISVSAWARWVKDLGPKTQQAIQDGLLAGAARCIPILHRATMMAPPASDRGSRGAFSSGFYQRAWKFGRVEGGSRVWNDATYAGVIEHGRRSASEGGSFPPPSVLAKWAQRKLGLSAKEAASVGFAIARAIYIRGLRPRRVLTDAIPAMTNAVTVEVENAIDRAWEAK